MDCQPGWQSILVSPDLTFSTDPVPSMAAQTPNSTT
jgi:hypothetical protein